MILDTNASVSEDFPEGLRALWFLAPEASPPTDTPQRLTVFAICLIPVNTTPQNYSTFSAVKLERATSRPFHLKVGTVILFDSEINYSAATAFSN
jgi:hypothetical protein